MPQIDTTEFPDPGLYLLWPEGLRRDLTRAKIQAHARAMLDDPERIPAHVRAAADYQACEICPERYTAEICHAIMTALPFVDDIDRYMSYDNVTAVYRDPETDALHVAETTMQDALKYVSILALTQYCEVGRQYRRYFDGVDPLMETPDIAAHVYRNIFLETGGDIRETETIVRTMERDILLTTRCQVERLKLISRRDAFLNAFVATHTTAELLFAELHKHLAIPRNAAPVTVGGDAI